MNNDNLRCKSRETFVRRQAQQQLDIGAWANEHENTLKLAQQALSSAQEFFTNNMEMSSVDFYCQIEDAIDAIIFVVARLRALDYDPSEFNPNQLVVRNRGYCPEVIALPPILDDPEPSNQANAGETQ